MQLAGVREHLFEMRLSEAVPDFQVQWLLSGKQESPERVELNNHRFRVYGSLVRSRNRTGVQSLVATTYWVDTTEADDLRERYTATRPVLEDVVKAEPVLDIDGLVAKALEGETWVRVKP